MRILYVVNQMGAGGIESLLVSMVGELLAQGHEPLVLSMAPIGPLFSDLVATGVPIRSVAEDVKELGFFKPGLIRKLRGIVKEDDPDVVHLCDIISGHMGRLACLGLRVPVVYALHSMAPHGKRKYRVASRLLSYATDHYIAVSSEVWDATGAEQNRANVPHSVIHNGVNDRLFAEAPELDILGQLQKRKGPVVVSCGRLVPLKNIDLLIRSFASLLEKLDDALLFIIGDGAEREALERLVRDKQVDDQVHFMGFRDDVPGVLKAFSKERAVMAMPSDYEGFSLAFAEALYCGLPVVISEQAAPKGVAGPGVAYCALDQDSLASVLYSMLHDELQYVEMSRSARKLGAQLTIENTVDQHVVVYAHLIEERGSR